MVGFEPGLPVSGALTVSECLPWKGCRWFFDLRVFASDACTAYTLCMQYTIRGIPPAVDHALRERARATGKSLNEATLEALSEGSGMTAAPRKRRSLADIAGTWRNDRQTDAALAAQDRIDEELWR